MKTSGVRFGIRSKLMCAFGCIILLLAFVSTATYISFVRVDTKVSELFETHVEFARLARETENELLRLRIIEKDFFLQYRMRGIDYAAENLADVPRKVDLIRENLQSIRNLQLKTAAHRQVEELLEAITTYEKHLFNATDLIEKRMNAGNGLEVRLRSAGDELEALLRDHAFNVRDSMAIRRFERQYLEGDMQARGKIESALLPMKNRLQQAPLRDAARQAIAERLTAYEKALKELKNNDDAIRQERTIYENALSTLQPAFRSFEHTALTASAEARRNMQTQSRTMKIIILSMTACAVLLTLLFAGSLSRAVTRQIQHIMTLLGKIGVGDYRARTPVTSNDELGMMAGELNTMLDNIVTLIQTREERDRMQAAVMKLLDDVSGFADGDLTKEAEVTEDFTGAIADAFNMTITQLREIIKRVQHSTNTVSTSAHRIYTTAEQIAHGNESGAMGVSTITAAIDEMAASVQAVSENASQSAGVAEKALESSRQGTRAVRATIEGMTRIRERVQETAKRIKRLGESSQEIGEIVQVINDLADRTSILALNASIQAAMAGEQGRGFAVVAEEVERLAQRSARATDQIAGLVSTIQGETNETVIAMEETTREVVAGSRLSQDAGQALTQIEKISHQLAELIQSISLSSRQQARAADDVSISMNQISEITQQTADGTKHAAAQIRELATLADELRNSVSTFKLPEPKPEADYKKDPAPDDQS